jgi:hypothetical protein
MAPKNVIRAQDIMSIGIYHSKSFWPPRMSSWGVRVARGGGYARGEVDGVVHPLPDLASRGVVEPVRRRPVYLA